MAYLNINLSIPCSTLIYNMSLLICIQQDLVIHIEFQFQSKFEFEFGFEMG